MPRAASTGWNKQPASPAVSATTRNSSARTRTSRASPKLFAALHGTLTEKCYALGMGLIFGWAAEQTDSPAPGVVLHILNNGLVLARALAERGMG